MPDTIIFAFKFFATAVVTHILVCRLAPSGKFMFNGLLVGFFSLALACAWEFKIGRADFLALYMLLTAWLAYLMFFINLLNSVTLKMLERLAEAPGGNLSGEEFNNIFNEESGIKARLADMDKNGFIKIEVEHITLTNKARQFLKMIFLARKILSVNRAG